LLLFWACFLQISILQIAYLWNFMDILLFQFTEKWNLGVFLCKFAHFGLVFSDLPPCFCIKTNLLFLRFCEFFYQTHARLVFPLNYTFWACFSNLLACFYKITWHHWPSLFQFAKTAVQVQYCTVKITVVMQCVYNCITSKHCWGWKNFCPLE